MTPTRVVSEIPKNARETIRVTLGEYQGQATIDVRTWFTPGDGRWKPGPKGLTVGVRHLPDLADALAKALAEAQDANLLQDG